MKYFIALSAVLLAAAAMPTQLGDDADGFVDASVLNGTRNIPFGQAGWATVSGGTRGGAGGAVWTVWDPWALRDAVTGNNARIIYVRGRIDLTALFTGSPGVALRVGNWKTIIGTDSNAMIFGGGLRVSGGFQVIIQNIKFHNALSYAPGEQPSGNGFIANQVAGAWSTIDAVGIDNSIHVWVDHCEFADDPWNANNTPDNRRRHDGQIDITRGANWVSVSNSIFRNHNLVTLVGSADNLAAEDNGRLKVTFYLNWYQGVVQRNPRVRFGEVHVLNNLYTDISSYGVGVGVHARIVAERNAFVNCRRAWGWASGVATGGNFVNMNNRLVNSGHDAGIPSNIAWRPAQSYGYSAMNEANVEAHVRRYAGLR